MNKKNDKRHFFTLRNDQCMSAARFHGQLVVKDRSNCRCTHIDIHYYQD